MACLPGVADRTASNGVEPTESNLAKKHRQAGPGPRDPRGKKPARSSARRSGPVPALVVGRATRRTPIVFGVSEGKRRFHRNIVLTDNAFSGQ